ncbi:hypothetical protein [Larkinella rosea]|uniref:Uncharacterized protein n=1 Tax=Larkinella rosea TaxID=2025312 RepID=A0A3P1C0F2_9BACT|nr:hypothetical protein [Larkinella rosea]RRB06881.1 hypothetical protein EHT25_03580 [Larkinella rosea]
MDSFNVEESADSTKIIPLGRIKPTIIPKHHHTGFCKHSSILVDEKNRMLECEQCGQVIDPFDYIWEESTNQSQLFTTITELRREMEWLMKQKNRLEKAVLKLKQRKMQT